MRTDLQIGDKVVCITAIPSILRPYFSSLPKKGGIYCVSGVEESVTGKVIIDLVGIVSRPDKDGRECGHLASYFRKIIPASERHTERKSAEN